MSETDRRQLRPLGRFLVDLVGPVRDCFWRILALALLGWAPSVAAFAAALRTGLTPGAVEELMSSERLVALLDGSAGQSATPAGLVADMTSLLGWLLSAAVLYMVGQAFVSAGSTFLLFRSSCGFPVSLGSALGWAGRRLPRSFGSLLVASSLIGAPLASVVALLLLGAPALLVASSSMVALVLVLAFAGRLALVPASASLAPLAVPALRSAVRGVGRSWFGVLVRLLFVAFAGSVLAGAVSVPLFAVGVPSGATLLVVALTVRVMLSLIGAAFGFASTVLVYQDLRLPTDARLGSVEVPGGGVYTSNR